MKKWKIEIKETESGVVIDAPFITASDEMTALEWAVKEIVAFTAYALAAAATSEDYVEGAKERIAAAEQGLFDIKNEGQSIN
ncbi:hypothetical protein HMPREF2865_05090 [Neisseria sp. HMSC073G10]|jgi:hypothetical protein|uniref:hypothetical protein n=1 Tax=Neisseria TaxID=482 RepID=UPI0008A56781|nr:MULTISPECIES: hypothetical protein [Neisseria]OFR84989.1 hypothetical protein HMPREF2865_05090 [Neisseria sp. HMSC073G10]